MAGMNLNGRAAELCRSFIDDRDVLRIGVQNAACGARLIDCGIQSAGGLQAGRRLAEICMAGLGSVRFVPAPAELPPGPAVMVSTDHPVSACMAAQYAGWQIAREGYFAMGSGPMRAAAAKEPLFAKLDIREKAEVAVGILESRKLPTDAICQELAKACGVEAKNLTLLVAPTASTAGSVQVVARSVETALHKLLELGFDLTRVVSGWGLAPLPPVSGDDLVAIGRTNDAVLYGGEVLLWVRGDDASLEAIGPRVPSGASPDHGQPFSAIFERAGRDFYKIDPHLFSPAVVTLANLDTGRAFRFGHTLPRVIHESFDIRQITA